MHKEVLRSIENIEIYPVISFVIFGVFFLGLLLYVFTMKKSLVAEMKAMPFEPEKKGTDNALNNTIYHES